MLAARAARRHRGRPAGLSSPAGDAGARGTRPAARLIDTDFPVESKFDYLPDTGQPGPASARFLTVQEGCDKFCTFCVVPYTRGAEYSRPAAAMLAEARAAGRGRRREITLLGQNVNAYHGAGAGRAGLGPRAPDPGAGRDRRARAHPLHDLASARHGRGADRRACATSAADAVPASAGAVRLGPHACGDEPPAYVRRTICASIETLRTRAPDMALSSDFIVGFPGETEADFAATLALVEQVGFAQAYLVQVQRRGPARRRPDVPARSR